MRELLEQIETWIDSGQSVALATVIKTWGSSPRQVGAGMALTADGGMAGSISGGCVEGAVIDASLEVLKSGKTSRLHFGVADSEAWEIGLACGGEIEVFVRVFSRAQLEVWKSAFQTGQAFWSALLVDGADKLLGNELILLEDGNKLGGDFQITQQQLIAKAVGEVKTGGKPSSQTIEADNLGELFLNRIQMKPTLIIVGGVHIAVPLVNLAEIVGFEVIVIDPRRLFGTEERFPGVKQVLSEWPEKAFQKIKINNSTAIVMLTHDPKIDDPALKIALSSRAFYIGALGSKKTHKKRVDRLAVDGVESEKLNLIHAPIGLNLGGRSPEEIALAVMAQIVKVWNSAEN
ncbi:MAG: XdhC family protein [Anaerolineales bacterium]|nr:XdhC family protein [Anaerolineales bacterium]